MSDTNPWPTVDIFDMPIAAIRLAQLFDEVARAIDGRRPTPLRIAYANAHTCNLFHDDPRYRAALLRADLIYADGNGPRLAAWLAGASLPERMTAADWIVDLCRRAAERGDRLFLLGTKPEMLAAAVARLQKLAPELQLVGSHHGFLRDAQASEVLEAIRRAQPDILLVGMGSPRQEIWMAEHAERAGVPVVWSVGAALDYASGLQRRPPRWLRRLGLEWLGRLLIEPRRLAGRYLIGLPRFVIRALAFAWRARRRGPEGAGG